MTHKLISLFVIVTASTATTAAYADTVKTGGNVINETWNLAGSPYIVQGDLTVPSGAFLTIEAGTIVQFASTDAQRSGNDPALTELIIRGAITVNGTAAQPVQFRGASTSSGSWYGLVLDTTATSATLSNLQISNPKIGIQQLATSAIVATTAVAITSPLKLGIEISAGTPTYDRVSVIGSHDTAFQIDGAGGAILSNCLALNSTSGGIMFRTSGGTLTISNCTINACQSFGVWGLQGGDVTITNTIITNSQFGVFHSTTPGPTIRVAFSDVWNNGSGNFSDVVIIGSGVISQNPQFVSATDLSLQPSSVCIDVGTAIGAPLHDIAGITRPLDGDGINGTGFDMGAYELARTSVCGNGAVEPGEACDSGAANGMYGACNTTCSGPGPRCGDGIINGPEACDDGNHDNTDACLNTCVAATCGDGYVHAGVETCDDGNRIDTDSCTNSCVPCSGGSAHGSAGDATDGEAESRLPGDGSDQGGCSGSTGGQTGALGSVLLGLSVLWSLRRSRSIRKALRG